MDGRRLVLAARPRAGRLLLAQRHGLCARPRARLRPLGRRRAPRAGPTPRSCPISGGPRPSPAAPTLIAAATGRSRHPRHAATTRCIDAWLLAGEQAGYPVTADMNGFRQEGVGPDGHDHPPRPPLERRQGLSAPGAGPAEPDRAHRLPRDARSCSTGRAPSGSSMPRAASSSSALATREVILAGGAINSPQLLMLSGIGPADQLRGVGVPVVARPARRRPRTCRTTSRFYFQVACREPITLLDAMRPHNMLWIGLRWYLFHDGPAASSHLEAGGFIRSRRRRARIRTSSIISCRRWSRITAARRAGCTPSRPMRARCGRLSRGWLELRSADPREHPLDPAQLPGRGAGPDRPARLRPADPRDLRPAGLRPLSRPRAAAGRRGHERRRDRRLRPRARPTAPIIPAAPAGWARTRWRWSTPNAGCAGSRGCAWSTPRSCRAWSPAISTRRRSCWPRRRPT